MTKIKLCGLTRECEIEWANALKPDYIGFVFVNESRRKVSYEKAKRLKALLDPSIQVVGVFAGETPEVIAELSDRGVIDRIQLHGNETDAEVRKIKELTDLPVMQAFCITGKEAVERAEGSKADLLLLDAGAGSGKVFDWNLLKGMKRPFFLAGGLTAENVARAVEKIRPYGVDASSSLETDGRKDQEKMAAFVDAVRRKETEHDE